MIGDDANRAAAEAGETNQNVTGEFRLHLIEVIFIDDRSNELLHIVGAVGIIGNEILQSLITPQWIVVARAKRWIFLVVAGKKTDQLADHQQTILFGIGGDMRHAAFAGMGLGAAQSLLGHIFVGHGLDHVRSGDEHVAVRHHHEDEIGNRRRVYSAARAWPHDPRDLRYDAGRHDVTLKNFTVPRQAVDAFLYARPAGIVEADDRRAVLYRHVHHFADFVRDNAAQATAKNSEVL